MTSILGILALCITLTIIALVIMQTKASGAQTAQQPIGRELSNAEVTAIITRKRD